MCALFSIIYWSSFSLAYTAGSLSRSIALFISLSEMYLFTLKTKTEEENLMSAILGVFLTHFQYIYIVPIFGSNFNYNVFLDGHVSLWCILLNTGRIAYVYIVFRTGNENI